MGWRCSGVYIDADPIIDGLAAASVSKALKMIDKLSNSFTCHPVPGLSGTCRTFPRATNTNRNKFYG